MSMLTKLDQYIVLSVYNISTFILLLYLIVNSELEWWYLINLIFLFNFIYGFYRVIKND